MSDYHTSSVLDAFPPWLLFVSGGFVLVMSGYYLWSAMSGRLQVRYGLLGILGCFAAIWLLVSAGIAV
jgi:hypothetical protein